MAWFQRLLLRVFPADFRERRGDELEAFWRAQRSELRYRGVAGRARLLLSMVHDTVASGLRLRWSNRSMGGVGMRTLWMDLLYARRSLRAAPLFSGLAIATLALGIGAVTTVFAVVEGVILRPLPYPDPDRLVAVSRTDVAGETPSVSWPDLRDWMEQATGFEELAGYVEATESFEWDGGAEAVSGARVTANYFSMMGVPLALGRTFTSEEDALGGPRAVVLSHDLWRTRFDADPTVIGRTVSLAAGSVPIVGVAAPGFSAPLDGTRFWVPLQDDQLLADVGLPTGRRSLSFIHVVGRLEQGVDAAVAGAALRSFALRIDEASGKSSEQMSRVTLVALDEWGVGDIGATLALLLAAAALVLVVATANVAGLSVGRGRAREQELAVRTALGAGRGRLVWQLLVEGLLLAALAGVIGATLAWGAQGLVLALAPPGLPRADAIEMNGFTLAFATGATVLSGLAFGLLPGLGASRADPARQLAGARGSSVARSGIRSQHLLVTLQLAVAVVLLTGAGLLGDSFLRLSTVERGFDAETLVVATVAPSEARYSSPEQVEGLYREILSEVRAMPGVVSASTTYSPPLFGNGFETSVLPEGEADTGADRFWAGTVVIGDDYFRTNGIEMLAGREFGPDDRLGAPLVVIVNEAMAARLWPGEDPLGKRFEFSGGLRGSTDSFDRAFFPDAAMTVVGVAADIRRSTLAEPPEPEYYRPHRQLTWGFQYLLVRAEGEPGPVAAGLRERIWAVDATIPVREVRTMTEQVSSSLASERFRMLLIVVFAGLTGMLAVVGLYSVMTLAVARRVREMGIRMALGASRASVVGQTVGRGLRLVGIGTGLGVLAAVALGRLLGPFLETILFETQPVRPTLYLVVVLGIAAVGVVASWLPARRAGRVDPVLSLRHD